MDTLTFITIITAIATLIGAISPIIVAFIQSNKDKQQNSVLLPPNVTLEQRTRINWLVVFFFAILSGIIGYSGAKVIKFESPTIPISEPIPSNEPNATLSAVIPSNSETPNSISTPIIKTSIPQTATMLPQNSSILLNEDFEDGVADGFITKGSISRIIADETGNYVYEIDTTNSTSYAGADFGSNSWTNYSVSYRVRLVEFSTTNDFPLGVMSFGSHSFTLTPYYKIFALVHTETGNWNTLATVEHVFKKNEWVNVIIEVKGSNIKVSTNGKSIMDIGDKNLKAGLLAVSTAAHTVVQFDDILVESLSE